MRGISTNPANDNFLIEIENPQAQGGILEIYDINARTILERKNDYTREMKIDISQYNKGIYLWRYINENKQIQSGKLIKE